MDGQILQNWSDAVLFVTHDSQKNEDWVVYILKLVVGNKVLDHWLFKKLFLWLDDANDSWVFMVNIGFVVFFQVLKKPILDFIECGKILFEKGLTHDLDESNVLFDTVYVSIDRHMRYQEVQSSSIYIHLLLLDWKSCN